MINETFFQELLIRQKESGLSVRDFCSNEGIAPSTYYYWLKKHNKNLARPKEFIPLVVRDHYPARKGNRMVNSHLKYMISLADGNTSMADKGFV